MKKLVFLFCLLLSFLSFGQDNTLINDLAPLKNSKSQIKYILNLNIDSIPEDGFSKLLKIKLNSELNNLGDLFAFYADGKDLELSKKEQSVLESRVSFIANWFVTNKKYALIEVSDKTISVEINIENISSNSVVVISMSKNPTISEREDRSEYIYELFSNQVRNSLN